MCYADVHVCVCTVCMFSESNTTDLCDIIIPWLRFVSPDGHSNWILSFLMFIVIVFVVCRFFSSSLDFFSRRVCVAFLGFSLTTFAGNLIA